MSIPARADRDLMRAINRSAVLNTIKTHGPLPRTEIARANNLSAATITGIVAELIRDGLVFEKEEGDSSGGRPPILLALNPRNRFVIGLKLTEDRIIGALTDLEATILHQETVAWSGPSPEAAVDGIEQLIVRLLPAAGVERHLILGIGIGLAGIIDAQTGLVRQSPYLPWRDLDLRGLIQDRLSIPVFLDNDVNMLTLAEKWYGSGQGVANFLVVTVGRGVGLGIVVNNQFYRGVSGGAGEFGHTVVDAGGPPCDCGKRGCLEAYIEDGALLRQAHEAADLGALSRPVETIEDLVALAENGDPAARRIFAEAGEVLGRSLANLINIFNPELILLAGEGTRAGQWLFDPMRREAERFALPGLLRDVRIQFEPWGDEAWARGAASLVLRLLFESPLHREWENVLH
jgi:N-acetylglucosamine repressor